METGVQPPGQRHLPAAVRKDVDLLVAHAHERPEPDPRRRAAPHQPHAARHLQLRQGRPLDFDAKVQYIRSKANNRPVSGANGSNMSRAFYTYPTSLDVRTSAIRSTPRATWPTTTRCQQPLLDAQVQPERRRPRPLPAQRIDQVPLHRLARRRGARRQRHVLHRDLVAPLRRQQEPPDERPLLAGESRFFENNYSFLVSARRTASSASGAVP